MDLFFTQSYDLTTTPTRIVEAASIKRTVRVIERDYQSYVGFEDYSADNSKRFGIGPLGFILPAGTELWATSDFGGPNNGESVLEVMVTDVGDVGVVAR